MDIRETTADEFIMGNNAAFKTIYEATRGMLYAVIYRMTGNAEDAEDLLHDVYVRAYEKRHQFKKGKAALSTWLYSIAVNHTLNVLKQKKRWDNVVFDPAFEISMLEKLTEQDDHNLVNTVLTRMNPDYRVCVILKDVEDKPYEEIAELLQIPVGTVRSRLNRGRAQLQTLFQNADNALSRGELHTTKGGM